MHAPPIPLVARRPAAPLTGPVRVPGDKSISHRAFMFGALAVGETRITGLLAGEDVLRTAAAMRALGADIVQDGATWRVAGRGVGGLIEPADILDMGNSGTTALLLTGVLASHDLFAFITGGASLRGRPMRRVIDPLEACGARFTSRSGGRLPLAIEGARDALPIECRLPAASAQVKSALLLAGLNARGQTRIEEPTPTRDHSETMLRHFGAELTVETMGAGRVVTLQGQPDLRARDVVVPGDPSCAAFPLVAALLVPGSAVTVLGVGLNPLRAGLFQALREMGADLTVANRRDEGGEAVGDLTARHGALTGIDVPLDRAPSLIDEYPILAIAAAFAHGTTRLRGPREQRMRENGRLAATAAILASAGVDVEVEGDDLLVHGDGRVAGGCTAATLTDYRLAMSALVLGLAADAPVTVDAAAFIDTGFPGFAVLMRSLGADLS